MGWDGLHSWYMVHSIIRNTWSWMVVLCVASFSRGTPPDPAGHPQIAACPEVTVVSVADVPAEVLEKEKAIEMEKEDIKSKPEQMRCAGCCALWLCAVS